VRDDDGSFPVPYKLTTHTIDRPYEACHILLQSEYKDIQSPVLLRIYDYMRLSTGNHQSDSDLSKAVGNLLKNGAMEPQIFTRGTLENIEKAMSGGGGNNNSGGFFNRGGNNNSSGGGGFFSGGNNSNNGNSGGGFFNRGGNSGGGGGFFNNNSSNNNGGGGGGFFSNNSNSNNSGGGGFFNRNSGSGGGFFSNNSNNNSGGGGGGFFNNNNNSSNNNNGGGFFNNNSNNGGGFFNNNNNSGGGFFNNNSSNNNGGFFNNNNSNNNGGFFNRGNNNGYGFFNNNNNNSGYGFFNNNNNNNQQMPMYPFYPPMMYLPPPVSSSGILGIVDNKKIIDLMEALPEEKKKLIELDCLPPSDRKEFLQNMKIEKELRQAAIRSEQEYRMMAEHQDRVHQFASNNLGRPHRRHNDVPLIVAKSNGYLLRNSYLFKQATSVSSPSRAQLPASISPVVTCSVRLSFRDMDFTYLRDINRQLPLDEYLDIFFGGWLSEHPNVHFSVHELSNRCGIIVNETSISRHNRSLIDFGVVDDRRPNILLQVDLSLKNNAENFMSGKSSLAQNRFFLGKESKNSAGMGSLATKPSMTRPISTFEGSNVLSSVRRFDEEDISGCNSFFDMSPNKESKGRGYHNSMMSQAKVKSVSAPTLTSRAYHCNPSIDELNTYSDRELAAVENFTIWNSFGRIEFLRPVDLRDENLDRALRIQKLLVEIYPEDNYTNDERPIAGEKLNMPAYLSFFGVSFKKTGPELIDDLRRQAEKQDSEFVEYDPEKQLLKTKVWYF
jgi:hypothetical protein